MQSVKILLILLLFGGLAQAQQTGSILGQITANGEFMEFVNVQVEGTDLGAISDVNGKYEILEVPFGEYELVTTYLGYETLRKSVLLSVFNTKVELNFEMQEAIMALDRVVVTGTRTFKRQNQSPVVVNVLDGATLENTQACNLSEGLRFQPGLRVETDCQTCNYTQLRMNGLGGGYSQILINGRPIFSPLTGLYGMEQIPTNMIERIEVVRGGGSALYGSAAIGGTVNVITKIPKSSNYDLSYTHQNINGGASDHILSGNATLLNAQGNAGASIFINNRRRETYDHNGDNYSELPELQNNSFGVNLFFSTYG